QSAAGSDHGSRPHHRDRNRVFPLPAHDGKEQKALSSTIGRGNDGLWKAWENDKAVFPPFPQPLEIAAAIPTLPPPRLDEHEFLSKPVKTKTRRNDAQYHYPVGQIKWSKWATPE
ncbi:MAG: hypothetical protein WCF54_14255, partial [Terracidiphilus sp.]